MTVRFDGKEFIRPGDSVGRRPEIEVRSDLPVVYGRLNVFLNAIELEVAGGAAYGENSVRFRLARELPPGQHSLRIEIAVGSGPGEPRAITSEIEVLAARDLHGKLLLFPSPATQSVNVSYELGTAQDLSLLIYDLNGKIVYRRDFLAGQPGGQGGYNQVEIDLVRHSRRPLSNGVYVAVLLKNSSNRSILAREKFIVLR